MSGRGQSSLRLSANELENALREERQKWRVFRLQQVREQARFEASRVRGAVQRRKEAVVQNLQTELLEKWQGNKENEVQQLQREYDDCLEAFGKAHNHAKEQPDAAELLAENMAINREKAAKRGHEAARAEREFIAEKDRDKNRINQLRESAIRKERLRASRVAQLPIPKAFVKQKEPVPKPVPKVQMYEHGTLTTTSYVPKNIVIEKELKSTKPSAHQLAEMEENALRAAKEAETNKKEVTKKEREKRGKTALYKERLHQKYRSMLEQLDQAHRDHYLSGFLKGDDQSIIETEDARKKARLSQQKALEMAVEKILNEKLPGGREDEVGVSTTQDGSDLKETSDDSGLHDRSEVHSSNQQGPRELQDEIRKHRLIVNNVLNDLHSSPREKGVQGNGRPTDDSGIAVHDKTVVSQGIRSESSVSSQAEPMPEDIMPVESDGKAAGGGTVLEQDHVQRHPSSSTVMPVDRRGPAMDHRIPPMDQRVPPMDQRVPPVDHRVPPVDHRLPSSHRIPHLDHRLPSVDHKKLPKEFGHDQANDIHFKETVPAHLMPEKFEYRRREIPESDTLSSQPSSEGTLLPGSSSDINVKIHFSSDSNSGEFTEVPPDRRFRQTIVHHAESARKYPDHLHSSGQSTSTEYFSLPSCIPPPRFEEAYNHNLERIQQKRQDIQRLLDGRECGRLPDTVTPVTYMQEMGSGEGSGRRPLRKRDKFELRKRELLHHYVRKLLGLREDELMQISASSVEGSGLTVSTLQTLLQSLCTSDEDTDFSSLVHLTNSGSSEVPSSPLYPDIDQIPTKLTRSPGIVTHCSLLPNIPSVNHSAPKIPMNDIERTSITSSPYIIESTNSSSSPYITIVNTPLPTHDVEHEPETSVSSPEALYTPSRLQTSEIELSESPLSTEVSSAAEVTTSDTQFEVNYQWESRVLLNLQAIQKLKQELLLRKSNLMKEAKELEVMESESVAPPAPIRILPERTADESLNPSQSNQRGLKLDRNLLLGDTLRKGFTPDKYQMQPPNISQKPDFHTTRLPTLPPCRGHVEDLMSDSEESASNFVLLNPEGTVGSTGTFTGPIHYLETKRKPARIVGGTTFRSLTPEETLKSELSDFTKTSSVSSSLSQGSVHTSTSELRKTDDLTKPEKSVSAEDQKVDVSDQKNKASNDMVQPTYSLEQHRVVFETPSLPKNSTLVPELPDGSSSNDQRIQMEEHHGSKGNSSQSSSSPVRSRKNSSESITSIPDMAEILQRFGLDWAKNVIHKTDKTGEDSSSGQKK
ncbi:LOW QUALITY PROTEIN: uncharacterized protein LOC135205526 [Macrobrachium nipponense]|uniref:LOW QUALITY PROTEIN: uncharacterized protein LOC135205526 n=1 Tax=Macrobrachium nipponense TaxID=159736 RepID=UPI0030C8893E